jgi:hypothetical protein
MPTWLRDTPYERTEGRQKMRFQNLPPLEQNGRSSAFMLE